MDDIEHPKFSENNLNKTNYRSRYLQSSLKRQKATLKAALPMTPVDSISFGLLREETAFLHGFYASDKQKTKKEQINSIIQFGGKRRPCYDLNKIHNQLAISLGAAVGSLRLLSGLHAHMIVFMCLAQIGDTVLLLPESAGGHFATENILKRLGLNVVFMEVDAKAMKIDIVATIELAKKVKPQFLFVDRSEGLVYEDFSFLNNVASCIKIFDASQYLPQIMTGRYQNPLTWGFDIMLFTVHKSFPGPQKAGLVLRELGQLWYKIQEGLGSFVSSAHIENTYHFGLALLEVEKLEMLSSGLVEIAYLLEKELNRREVPVVTRDFFYKESSEFTQHLWIKCRDKEHAYSFYKNLELCRIHVNYRRLPYGLGWGIRLGITTLIPLGLKSKDIFILANLISSIYRNGFNLDLRHEVRRFRSSLGENAIINWPNTGVVIETLR
ncbi:hypothetical protein WKI13_06060 [Teredinibacter turnerae]|uniref:hypothetical protein n=1 Tax=Teredinibacter turnerae TaxID=2426 RepID=UPI00037F7836|nr:hypothetical protein [Teredinibacter turnerae]